MSACAPLLLVEYVKLRAMTAKRLLYLGPFLEASIVEERGLRSHNAAGSNRMLRLALALRSAGYRPIMVAPATSLRARAVGGPVIHPARVGRAGSVAIVYAPAFNLPFFGALTSVIFQMLVMWRVMRQPLVGSIVYNFSPSLVCQALWLRLRRDLPVINNIEDISVPSLADWSPKTEARPVQQIVFWLCMNLVARLSNSYIVPTRRFLAYLPTRPTEVITGCISTSAVESALGAMEPLRVFYAGKIEREHGIVQFANALLLLDDQPVATGIRADISGAGPMSDFLEKELKKLKSLRATNHGFVSAMQYAELLRQADVCVVLQDPKGRYSDFKTPSKIYEFLGFGKAVISTRVGDIGELPSGVLTILDQLDAQSIATQLVLFANDRKRVQAYKQSAHKHALSHFDYERVGHRMAHLLETGG